MIKSKIHSFEKGIVSDLSTNIVPDGSYLYLENGELLSYENNVFVIKSIRGTSHAFSITDGYIPLATAIVENILFILSVNNSNGSEIGYVYLTDPNLSYLYLLNYKLNYSPESQYESFSNVNLGYTMNSKVSMIAKKIFDGSVNIYLCDGVNPNYCINTGKYFDGSLYGSNGIFYTPFSFTSKARLFLSANSVPLLNTNPNVTKTISGGRLKPGVYILFFRYVDSIRNKTKFLSYSIPFQVHPNHDYRTSIFLGENDEYYTNKKIVFQLTDLDQEYNAIEIGFVRKYNTTKGEIIEQKLVDRVYSYSGTMLNGSLDGTEKTVAITFEELYEPVPNVFASSHQTVINGRYFAAGLKILSYKKDKIKEYIKRLTVQFEEYYETEDYITSTNKSGYWPEQIYQFVAYVVFDDLTVSDIFPLAGYKDGMYSHTYNGYCKVPSVTMGKSIRIKIRDNAVVIDGYTAKQYLQNNSDDTTLKRIKYVCILRSERVKNLIYSGVAVPTTFRFNYELHTDYSGADGRVLTINGVQVMSTKSGSYSSTVKYEATSGTRNRYLAKAHSSQSYKSALHFPFVRGIAPAYFTDKTWCLANFAAYKVGDSAEQVRFAFFSPDVMLSKIDKLSNGQKVIIKRRYGVNPNAIYQSDIFVYNPGITAIDYEPTVQLSPDDQHAYTATAYVVNEDTVFGPANFCSRIRDYFAVGRNGEELLLDAQIDRVDFVADILAALRSNRTQKYIGLEVDGLTWNDIDYSYAYIYDIYLSPNDDEFFSNTIAASSEFKSYELIGTPIKIDQLSTSGEIYQGDCYYQPMLFLINKSFEFGNPDIEGDPDLWKDTYGSPNSDGINACRGTSRKNYHFGTYAYLKCHSNIHPGARCATKDRTYFEAEQGNVDIKNSYVLTPTFLGKALKYILSNTKQYAYESMEAYTVYGNPNIVYKAQSLHYIENDYAKYISGVVYSAKTIPGEIQDAYKIFDFSKMQVFVPELGGVSAIISKGDRFYLIHKAGVTLHTSEMQFKQKIEGETLSIGAGAVLPDVYKLIGEYGCQSFNEVCNGRLGLYGYDSKKDIIWIVDTEGQFQRDLATSSYAKEFVKRYKSDYGLSATSTNLLSSRVLLYSDDVMNTVHISIPAYNGITLVYNEALKAFTFAYKANPVHIIRFGNRLLSTCYKGNPSNDKKFYYMFDDNSDRLSIFDDELTFKFGFRSNGGNEEGLSLLPKIYRSVLFASQPQPFSRIKFSSEFITGEYNQFYSLARTDFWNNPEWKENMWCVPILFKTDSKEPWAPIPVDVNQVDIPGIDPLTGTRGLYVNIEVEGDKYVDNSDYYIKHAIITFKKSVL